MTNPERPLVNTPEYTGPNVYSLPRQFGLRLLDATGRAKEAFSHVTCREATVGSWTFGDATDVFVYKTTIGSWGETSIFVSFHHRAGDRIFDVTVEKQKVRLSFEDELASAVGRGEIARALRYDPYKAEKLGEKKGEDEKLEYFSIRGIV